MITTSSASDSTQHLRKAIGANKCKKRKVFTRKEKSAMGCGWWEKPWNVALALGEAWAICPPGKSPLTSCWGSVWLWHKRPVRSSKAESQQISAGLSQPSPLAAQIRTSVLTEGHLLPRTQLPRHYLKAMSCVGSAQQEMSQSPPLLLLFPKPIVLLCITRTFVILFSMLRSL